MLRAPVSQTDASEVLLRRPVNPPDGRLADRRPYTAPMKTYLVGGALRDRLLGLPVSDRDWLVVGATPCWACR